jgi:hypothetical protein
MIPSPSKVVKYKGGFFYFEVIQNLNVNLKGKRPNSGATSRHRFQDDTEAEDTPLYTQSPEEQPCEEICHRPVAHPLLDGKCVLSRELTITDNEILER